MIAWAAWNMIWASAAMLVVLAIRRPVAAAFGAGAAYALWLVPPLRLIAPPAAWFGAELPLLPPLMLLEAPAAAAAPLPSLSGPGQWVPILLAVWAGGAALLLLYQFSRYRAFLRRLSLSMRSAGSHKGVPLMQSDAVDGPLALGLLDRRIVVPGDFDTRYSAAERALALDHEAYHHRRCDLLANHVALTVLALNWFNPVAWAGFRAFRADQELSCDAAVTVGVTAEQRASYGRLLVKSASRPGLIAACPLNGADQLKRRLKMLNHHRKGRGRLWAGGALTATLAAATLLAGTPGQAQNKSQSQGQSPDREELIIIQQRDGAAPAGARREFSMRRNPDGSIATSGLGREMAERLERCQREQPVVDTQGGEGNQRARVLLCSSEGTAPANRMEALQRARERLAGQQHLSAETRQRILAELDRAIAEAR